MRSKTTLPEGYREIFSVNLQKNKKMAFGINLAALVLALIMAVPVHFVVPISTMSDMSHGFLPYALRLLMLIVASLGYIVLHELVHGITMKSFGTKKVKYGFTGTYAFAGSDDYYDKKSYLTIAMAPVVVWGIVLAVLNLLVPVSWFWVVYLVQISNIAGAAGDFYVTWKFARLPKDILVQDIGMGMTVYSAQEDDVTK